MYKKDEIEDTSLKVIQENDIVFLNDIFPYVPFSRAVFYNKKCNQLDTIKRAIDDNRTRIKLDMLHRWIESDNPVLQIAAYKLICSKDEIDRLNANSLRITIKPKSNQTSFNDEEPIFVD